MDEQLDIFEYMKTTDPFKRFRGNCHCCYWGSSEDTCQWRKSKFMGCENKSKWAPSPTNIPRLCGNCKYSNQFEYQLKPEYEEDARRHNGYSRKGADDPLEEPNIYCDRDDGSVNRRSPYRDLWQEGFGIGHWDRQHEWDTCDAWELDKDFFGRYSDLKEE